MLAVPVMIATTHGPDHHIVPNYSTFLKDKESDSHQNQTDGEIHIIIDYCTMNKIKLFQKAICEMLT